MTSMDEDLEAMTSQELKAEVVKLRAGIRQHRDASGHNLCWYVPELWNLLPEKIEPTPIVPPFTEFLECCRLYRGSLLTQEMMDAQRKRILDAHPEDLIDE